MHTTVPEIERLLGYTFRDPTLLEEALTHSSYADHPSYQRLEFVGDAALGLAFAKFLYLTNPDLGPGPLTALRAANISTEKLSRVAVRHDLYRFLRHNSPRLDQLVNEFTDSVMLEPEEDVGCLLYGGSTVKAPKMLADIVESIAAAVYVDCNYDLELLWKVFRGILEPIITSENVDKQPVTRLYQVCQKQNKVVEIQNWRNGSKNTTKVFVDGKLIGVGSSDQKAIAKLNAVRDALQKLTESCPAGVEEEKDESKLKLKDLCSDKHWIDPIYKIEKELGPEHCKRFICSVQITTEADTFITIGDPKPRLRDAENSAAFKMLSEVLIAC